MENIIIQHIKSLNDPNLNIELEKQAMRSLLKKQEREWITHF
ncbi:hypothetical protein [Mycoplasma sp. P36-A1]